jgi:hypothetical protein
MGRGRIWTDADYAKLLSLRTEGRLSVPEIARALGRTTGACWAKLDLNPPNSCTEAIGQTNEDRHFANDAIIGSARLRAEIERVFGQQRIAA